MLSPFQVNELKLHLEKAQNPLFYFDNDPDGLCSFLLLQRAFRRGKGVAVKGDLSSGYFRKITELNPDYIFILDKPLVSAEFFEEIEKINLPVVWIDHHEIDKKNIPDFVSYYNPFFNPEPSHEPVTALCYELTDKKEDLWLAVVGCISDGYIPDFYLEFQEKYFDLSLDSKNAFDILYGSRIGKISLIFSYALKDRTTNVINMLRFLMKVKSPYEILEETKSNKSMHERFKQVNKKVKALATKVIAPEEKILFFKYGGDLSISSELANEFSYKFPGKIIVVAYVNGAKANISLRGKNIKEKLLKAISGIQGAKGGGHENAVGAQVNVDDLDEFKKNLFESM